MRAKPDLRIDRLPTSSAYLEQREALKAELRGYYDSLVMEYRYYACLHYHQPFVSYKVIADLVKLGWRRQATAV